jgi:enoyl-CoA hydratase/carnithine racemase
VTDVPAWSAPQAIAMLADPAVPAELLDAAAVVIDLRETAPLEPPAGLHALPCPVLALIDADGSTDWPVDLAIAESSDDAHVLANDATGAMEVLTAAASRAPAASRVLVQVLRATTELPVTEALVVESLAYSLLLTGPDFRDWLAGRSLPGASEDTDPPVLVRRDGPLLELVLNRVSVRNAYDARMRDALHDALSIALLDDSVEQVVLRANGPSFCSGGDLRDFGTSADLVRAHAIRLARHPGRLLGTLGARAEVWVHGACVGAGAELPAFAGRVVARGDATFRLPELAMGTIPGAGGTVSLARRIGRQRTLLLALSGRDLPATDALRWGLIDDVVGELPESAVTV